MLQRHPCLALVSLKPYGLLRQCIVPTSSGAKERRSGWGWGWSPRVVDSPSHHTRAQIMAMPRRRLLTSFCSSPRQTSSSSFPFFFRRIFDLTICKKLDKKMTKSIIIIHLLFLSCENAPITRSRLRQPPFSNRRIAQVVGVAHKTNCCKMSRGTQLTH